MKNEEMLQLILEKLVNVEKDVAEIKEIQLEHDKKLDSITEQVVSNSLGIAELNTKVEKLADRNKDIDQLRVDVEVLKRALIQ